MPSAFLKEEEEREKGGGGEDIDCERGRDKEKQTGLCSARGKIWSECVMYVGVSVISYLQRLPAERMT